MNLLPDNTNIGRYKVLSRLDDGRYNYREVYKIEDSQSNPYALIAYDVDRWKTISGSDDDTVREIEALRRANFQGIPTFVEAGNHTAADGRHVQWACTQLIEGTRLDDYLSTADNIPTATLLHISCRIADIDMHISQLFSGGGHYNLCPQNIYIDTDKDGNLSVQICGLTHAGFEYMGKPPFSITELNAQYRAPETTLGHFTSKADIYSIATLVSYMFRTASDKSGTLPDEHIQHIIEKGRGRKPSLRYATVQQLRLALTCGLSEQTQDHTPEESPKPTTAQPQERKHTQTHNMQEKEKVNVQIAQRQGKGFAAIGGCHELKELMNRNLVSILKHQELAKQLGVAPPNVTLMYGPPGVGKTYVAERVAEEAGTNFCLVTPSTLASSYIHGSQQLIADLFKKLEKQSPVILAIDECDSLLPSRETDASHHQAGEVNELLTQLNNCADRGIYVLMMTNYPARLDYGALRRGRVDSLVYVGLPDEQTRKEILQLELKDRAHEEDINYDALSRLSQNFTSSDVSYCAKEAARRCFYDSIQHGLPQAKPISQAILEEVIRQTRPSVSEDQLRSYEQMREKIENLTPQRKRIGFNV